MLDLKSKAKELGSDIIGYRRDLHRIPESGLAEHKTSAYVALQLRKIGLEVHTGIAGTGVKAVLRSGRRASTSSVSNSSTPKMLRPPSTGNSVLRRAGNSSGRQMGFIVMG